MVMREVPVLIYTGAGGKRMASIAVASGHRYGARLPGTANYPPFFIDQDWRHPNRAAYMAALARHRPAMATVLDWEREDQLPEVLDWAEEAAQWTDTLILIPKVIGGTARLPRAIRGRPVVLGYCVNTQFSGTVMPIWEFAGWPVHLLGGSPQRQLMVWHHLSCIARVISADGNMTQKMAANSQFWVAGTARYAKNRFWPTILEADGKPWGHDAPYEAFRRSCCNTLTAWSHLGDSVG